MSFTLDDSSAELAYSDTWAVQPPSDPNLSSFFLQTYHVAQAQGATLNLSFTGSAIALFGSKGPGHANYSVQYDDDIIFLSAYADQAQFQQLLFSTSFTDYSSHFISLTALPDAAGARGAWLDFDFVQITNESSSAAASTPVATGVPPWATPTSSSPTPSSSGSSSAAGAAATSSRSPPPSSKVPTILAALFGSILALLLVALAGYWVLKRMHESRHSRERRFRYGAPPTAAARSFPRAAAMAQTESRGVFNLIPSSGRSIDSEAGSPAAHPAAAPAGGYAHVPPMSPPPVVESLGAGDGAGERERETTTPPSAARAFLSSSPILFKKHHKGDADSLRTDFLQV